MANRNVHTENATLLKRQREGRTEVRECWEAGVWW